MGDSRTDKKKQSDTASASGGAKNSLGMSDVSLALSVMTGLPPIVVNTMLSAMQNSYELSGFEHNKHNVTDEHLTQIPQIATEIKDTLKTSPNAKVVLTGHGDTTGGDDVNVRIGKRRAEAVKAELVKQGIAPEKIETQSEGEKNLKVKTDDNVREAANRRVQIHVQGVNPPAESELKKAGDDTAKQVGEKAKEAAEEVAKEEKPDPKDKPPKPEKDESSDGKKGDKPETDKGDGKKDKKAEKPPPGEMSVGATAGFNGKSWDFATQLQINYLFWSTGQFGTYVQGSVDIPIVTHEPGYGTGVYGGLGAGAGLQLKLHKKVKLKVGGFLSAKTPFYTFDPQLKAGGKLGLYFPGLIGPVGLSAEGKMYQDIYPVPGTEPGFQGIIGINIPFWGFGAKRKDD